MRAAAFLEAREDRREIHLAGPDIHQHFLRRAEVLDAHPDYQAIDCGGICYRVKLAVRVVEDIARVIPQAEVLLADQVNGFAALGAGRVSPAVRLDAKAEAFRGGGDAAFGRGPG